jgi:hypothetical protein
VNKKMAHDQNRTPLNEATKSKNLLFAVLVNQHHWQSQMMLIGKTKALAPKKMAHDLKNREPFLYRQHFRFYQPK